MAELFAQFGKKLVLAIEKEEDGLRLVQGLNVVSALR